MRAPLTDVMTTQALPCQEATDHGPQSQDAGYVDLDCTHCVSLCLGWVVQPTPCPQALFTKPLTRSPQ